MNIESEMIVIGCILKDNNCYDVIPTDFGAGDFSRESHRIIYQAIESLLDNGKPVDIILLAEALDAQKYLDKAGGLPYLGQMVESVFTTKNINHHVGIVKKDSVLRRLKASINDIQAQCDSGRNPIEIATEAERQIMSILDTKQDNDYVHISTAVDEAIEWENTDHKKVKTGLVHLDELTGGLGNGNLVIIAARPSMGKSSLAIQIGEHVSKSESVAVFSIEMTKREIAARMLKYHRSLLGDNRKAKDHLFGLNFHIDDTSEVTLGHIRTRCRRIKRQHGLSLLIVDYLQLIKGTGDNRNQEIGAISRGLKSLAKEFDIPVIALSQLSRKVEERADRRPVMSDLRESGEIEQDADLILFIYRDEVYDKNSQDAGIAEIICRKNRNGPTGSRKFGFKGEVTRFVNYEGSQSDGYDENWKPKRGGFSIVRDQF
jgi:replicative DNA helicase